MLDVGKEKPRAEEEPEAKYRVVASG